MAAIAWGHSGSGEQSRRGQLSDGTGSRARMAVMTWGHRRSKGSRAAGLWSDLARDQRSGGGHDLGAQGEAGSRATRLDVRWNAVGHPGGVDAWNAQRTKEQCEMARQVAHKTAKEALVLVTTFVVPLQVHSRHTAGPSPPAWPRQSQMPPAHTSPCPPQL